MSGRTTWCETNPATNERDRDHASREDDVPRRRDHQGRAGGVLRAGRSRHAASYRRASGDPRAVSPRHRRQRLLSKERREGGAGVARARGGAEKGWRRQLSSCARHARNHVAGESELHHAARLDVARARPLPPRPLHLRPRSRSRRTPTHCARRRSCFATRWRSSVSRVGSRRRARRDSTSRSRSTKNRTADKSRTSRIRWAASSFGARRTC